MRLLYYAIKYRGEYDKIKKAFENNEYYEEINYDESYITIFDEAYPKQLLDLENPPFVLFYRGDLKILQSNMICVVGGRNYSNEAKDNVKELCNYVDGVYISGLAKGIDGFVHETSEISVGVIGCGINQVYPKENVYLYAKTKLILSEYPKGVLPLKHHFPLRNRIMVALSKCLVVIEGSINSGTQISVNIATELGKEVFVFPKSYFNKTASLNHLLIEEGAQILKDVHSLIDLNHYLNN